MNQLPLKQQLPKKNLIPFNQVLAKAQSLARKKFFTLEENKNLSKTSKTLEKIISNDTLVHLYEKARKKLKSRKSNENILTYRNIAKLAKLEVKNLPYFSTLNK